MIQVAYTVVVRFHQTSPASPSVPVLPYPDIHIAIRFISPLLDAARARVRDSSSVPTYYAQDLDCKTRLGLGPDSLGQSPERTEKKSSVFASGLFGGPLLTSRLSSQGLSPMS